MIESIWVTQTGIAYIATIAIALGYDLFIQQQNNQVKPIWSLTVLKA